MPNEAPKWLDEENTRTAELVKSGKGNVNPDATINPPRATKAMRFRTDYHLRFDQLVAREKYRSGKNGPALVEEALADLFEKYGV